jgi:hypothetical protein
MKIEQSPLIGLKLLARSIHTHYQTREGFNDLSVCNPHIHRSNDGATGPSLQMASYGSTGGKPHIRWPTHGKEQAVSFCEEGKNE